MRVREGRACRTREQVVGAKVGVEVLACRRDFGCRAMTPSGQRWPAGQPDSERRTQSIFREIQTQSPSASSLACGTGQVGLWSVPALADDPLLTSWSPHTPSTRNPRGSGWFAVELRATVNLCESARAVEGGTKCVLLHVERVVSRFAQQRRPPRESTIGV